MPAKDQRRISEMRNLGPACESDFNAVGIFEAHQLIDLGVERAFIQMLNGRMKVGRSSTCCNAAYLYALHGAIYDLDWRGLPEKTKNHYKAFAAELRDSGQFR